jgi:mannose-6-phosphate isomerase-like protein (cupin superfamily)
MLVQVEQAQTNPSIATLCKLANALGIALVALVEVGDEPVVRRVTAGDIAWLWRGRSKGSAAGLIAGVEAPVPVELWEWRIGARDAYDAIAHPAGTREFVYVLDGVAAVSVDGVEVVVAAGECAVFQADRPHRYAAARGRATRFVMIVIEPIEPPAQSSRRAKRAIAEPQGQVVSGPDVGSTAAARPRPRRAARAPGARPR